MELSRGSGARCDVRRGLVRCEVLLCLFQGGRFVLKELGLMVDAHVDG